MVFAIDNQNIASQHLNISHQQDGTLLSIEDAILNDARTLFTDGSPAYFRLRVAVGEGENNPIVRAVPKLDKFLQSSYDEIEYLDFRVNEARTLPDLLESQMRQENGDAIKMRVVAFLTAIPMQSDISVANTPSHKMRLLEHNQWNTYIVGGIPEGMMVYHWKREEAPASTQTALTSASTEINDFTAFVKLTTHRCSRRVWLIYLGIAFVLGIGGNIAANYAQKGIDNGTTYISNFRHKDTLTKTGCAMPLLEKKGNKDATRTTDNVRNGG